MNLQKKLQDYGLPNSLYSYIYSFLIDKEKYNKVIKELSLRYYNGLWFITVPDILTAIKENLYNIYAQPEYRQLITSLIIKSKKKLKYLVHNEDDITNSQIILRIKLDNALHQHPRFERHRQEVFLDKVKKSIQLYEQSYYYGLSPQTFDNDELPPIKPILYIDNRHKVIDDNQSSTQWRRIRIPNIKNVFEKQSINFGKDTTLENKVNCLLTIPYTPKNNVINMFLNQINYYLVINKNVLKSKKEVKKIIEEYYKNYFLYNPNNKKWLKVK